MDRGAHFHKCDFQVHTPRDPNWKGQGAVTADERRQYASEFVAACREKGIQAVTITDHHDVVFFKYIRDAASLERMQAAGRYRLKSGCRARMSGTWCAAAHRTPASKPR
jgi:hypothetical protein